MNRGALAGYLRRTYLQLDLRSLALGRIVLGLVLITDLLRRVPYLRDLYSNLGLIPNHTVLWRPPFPRIFSVFFMASLPEEAALWFFVAFVCFFCFLVGYRTRLFHLLSFAMTTSLHNRVLAAENWGARHRRADHLDGVPAARPPALRRRHPRQPARASRRDAADLGRWSAAATSGRPPAGGAGRRGCSPPFVYWLNFVHKSGPTGRGGSVVHYVLWQERIVTWVGLQVRGGRPLRLHQAPDRGDAVDRRGGRRFLRRAPSSGAGRASLRRRSRSGCTAVSRRWSTRASSRSR